MPGSGKPAKATHRSVSTQRAVSSRGGKKLCVAKLNEDCIAKTEDVLETYERPYDSREPVVCLDEKPVTLHADVRTATAAAPGREARQTNIRGAGTRRL